jgi:hypothetical protein
VIQRTALYVIRMQGGVGGDDREVAPYPDSEWYTVLPEQRQPPDVDHRDKPGDDEEKKNGPSKVV